MNHLPKRIYLLEKANISTALLKLGTPTLVGTLVSAFYNVVDTFWVGRLGTAETAGVSIVYPLTMLGMAFGMLFGSGANSSIARLLEKKDYEQAKVYSSTAVYTGLITIIILVAAMLIWIDPLLALLGATPGNQTYAKDYGTIFIIGLVFNVFNMSMNNILVAEGNSLTAMTAMLSGGVANLVLDPLLIFNCRMGVAGAAVATFVSRLISSSLMDQF